MKSPFVLAIIAAALLSASLAWSPLPQAKAETQVQPLKTSAAKLPWPHYGQAALGAKNYGLLATHGQQKSEPIASIAKLVTALSVLREKPLAPGEQGPLITITERDQAIYDSYYVRDGSLVPIKVGEKISERQVLEAMLLPSANNMADTAAIWAFGSIGDYTAYANDYIHDLGMRHTHVADASGFSPRTVGSAEDLVTLGIAAMENPVIASIVNESQAEIPVAGTIWNLNWMLGTDGVVGIKTGNTDQAGGCYVFAANRQVDGKTVTFIGSIMSAPTIHRAILDSKPLIEASGQGFKNQTVVSKGQLLGYYTTEWGQTAPVIAGKDITLMIWRGSSLEPKLVLRHLNQAAPAGTTVGAVTVASGQGVASAPVILSQAIGSPSWTWRLTH